MLQGRHAGEGLRFCEKAVVFVFLCFLFLPAVTVILLSHHKFQGLGFRVQTCSRNVVPVAKELTNPEDSRLVCCKLYTNTGNLIVFRVGHLATGLLEITVHTAAYPSYR